MRSKLNSKKATLNSRLFFQINPKIRYVVFAFGQMLPGAQICSPSPPFFRSTRYYWSECERKLMNYGGVTARLGREPWWLGLAFVWRVHVCRCWIWSAGDLSPPSLLIFCPLKWKSVLRLSSLTVNRELLCAAQDPVALLLSVRWSRQTIDLQIKNTILLTKTKLASNAQSINSLDFLPLPIWTLVVQMELLINCVYLHGNFVSSLQLYLSR